MGVKRGDDLNSLLFFDILFEFIMKYFLKIFHYEDVIPYNLMEKFRYKCDI
jgi:hypothetical protein